MEKKCTKCKQPKNLELFYNKSTTKDGKRSQCKNCTDESRKIYLLNNGKKRKEYESLYYLENKKEIDAHQAEYYSINKENILQKHFQRRLKNREKYMLKAAIQRAIDKNVPCTITEDDIKKAWPLNDKCIYCNCNMKMSISGQASWDSPSLDRIIPQLGYVIGNIRIICKSCNSTKGSLTNSQIFLNIGNQMIIDQKNFDGELISIKGFIGVTASKNT
jgi:hypothetical protein